MSQINTQTSSSAALIPSGTFPAVSTLDAVYRRQGGVSFTIKWRVETGPFGDIDTEDRVPFDVAVDDRGYLDFKAADFSRLCKLLDAADIKGMPILRVHDLAKLSGIRAQVTIEGGKVVSARKA